MMFASDERSKTYNDHSNSERYARHNNANPKKSLKLSLPTPPSPNEILDQSIGNDADDIDSGEAEGWFWYLGKRVRVRKPGKEYFVEKDVDDLGVWTNLYIYCFWFGVAGFEIMSAVGESMRSWFIVLLGGHVEFQIGTSGRKSLYSSQLDAHSAVIVSNSMVVVPVYLRGS